MATNEVTQINNSTTSASKRHDQDSRQDADNSIVIHCDGAGSRPDGKGSGFAWIQPHTGEKHVEHVDGLTNNQPDAIRAANIRQQLRACRANALAVC
jgi:hypothetical protein